MNEKGNTLARRKFIRKSTSAIAATAAAASFPSGTHAQGAGADELKIALIGCGGRGTGAASQALLADDNNKLWAMADIDLDKLDLSRKVLRKIEKIASNVDVPKERQFTGLDAFKKIMDLSEVDVVILTTPPGFRPYHFEAAIQAGKHVFMEKPVATDGPGIRKVLEMAAQAKERNLKVGVGMNRRHSPLHQTMIQKIHDGVIGEIPFIQMYNCRSDVNKRQTRKAEWSELEFQVRNWYYFTWLSGDFIVEQSVHDYDVVRWMKNEANPVSCQGQGGRIVRKGIENGHVYDHFSADYTFADGSQVITQHRQIPGCWNRIGETVHGTKGKAELISKRSGSIHLHGQKDPVWRGIEKANSYQIEHDELFKAIRNDTPFNEAERGAYSTLMAMMGRMAAYTGKEITWEDALNSKEKLAINPASWEDDAPFEPNSDMTYGEALPGRRI